MKRILQAGVAALLVLTAVGAGAQEKYALVIGNGAYASVTKLKNPVNDASDMAAALKGLGFKVDTLTDAGLGEMEEAVVRLGTRLGQNPGSWGFFFYAGHGVQSNGVNYLIPVDGDIKSETFLKSKALNAQSVLDTLAQAGNGLNVVVLDACRDNPFGWARSGNRGLVPVGGQPSGSIVAYATSVGSTAQDGTGRNGLFTSQLLKNLKTPGLEIAEVFKRTGADVKKASGNQQIPAIYNQFFDSAYLAGGPKAAPVNPAPAEPDFGMVTVAPGSLTVTVATAGTLTVVGRNVAIPAGGTLPVNKLAPGDYPLTVTYPDGQRESATVTVTSGQTVAVGFKYVKTAPKPQTPQGFVFVQGGTYQMGDTAGGGDSDEKPVHQVTVSSFSIGSTEVTQAQYTKVMGTNPSRFKGDNLPVEQVSWYDAVAYCNKLSESEGLTPAYTVKGTDVSWSRSANGYRLPTEAEWEFAAKGGTQSRGTSFSGGNSAGDLAWYGLNSGSQTRPVGTKATNELGLYDMSGNVLEWCWDWYGSYISGSRGDPTGPTSGGGRIGRGGSWGNDASILRSAYRYYSAPDIRNYFIGFRVVAPSVR